MNDNDSLTFTVDRGIVGHVPNVLDTTFDPTAARGHFQQDSASEFVYVADNATIDSQVASFASNSAGLGAVESLLYTNEIVGVTIVQLNCNAGAVVEMAKDCPNWFYTLSRESATSLKMYRNGP